jgi:hypothetical protein
VLCETRENAANEGEHDGLEASTTLNRETSNLITNSAMQAQRCNRQQAHNFVMGYF